ncbi:MAG: hypothetical protein HKP51_02795 [Sulfitobacter sp.]|nr:hypothetical protein [Sulfitobacter sp.]
MTITIHLAACAAVGLSAPILSLASSRPVPGDVALVIAPPWVAREAIVAAAGGQPVGPSSMPLGLLAQSDSPDFADNLRSAGAWFVADGRPVALLCGVST